MLSNYLPERDIAKIANRLQVPLIIADIINGDADLTDDIHLGLHEILSEDQPDSALLSIAMSALTIANTNRLRSGTFAIMKLECERIIAEYGMMWLCNAQAKTLDTNTVFETLVHIPEDLEILGEMLEFAKIMVQNNDPKTAQLCDILIIQASTQSIVAETYLDAIDRDDDEDLWSLDGKIYDGEDIDMGSLVAEQQSASEFYTDNIIEFPGTKH